MRGMFVTVVVLCIVIRVLVVLAVFVEGAALVVVHVVAGALVVVAAEGAVADAVAVGVELELVVVGRDEVGRRRPDTDAGHDVFDAPSHLHVGAEELVGAHAIRVSVLVASVSHQVARVALVLVRRLYLVHGHRPLNCCGLAWDPPTQKLEGKNYFLPNTENMSFLYNFLMNKKCFFSK